MSAVVRPAVAEDEPALYQMASEAAGSPLDRELFDALLHRGLADPTHRVALAFLQGEPAGWGELEIGYTLAENGLTGTVVQLYVRPAQREKGVGRGSPPQGLRTAAGQLQPGEYAQPGLSGTKRLCAGQGTV